MVDQLHAVVEELENLHPSRKFPLDRRLVGSLGEAAGEARIATHPRLLGRGDVGEWAYARLHRSDTERCEQFPIWLHTYNHHRGHTALGGQPPATRLPNLSGHYS